MIDLYRDEGFFRPDKLFFETRGVLELLLLRREDLARIWRLAKENGGKRS